MEAAAAEAAATRENIADLRRRQAAGELSEEATQLNPESPEANLT